MPGVGQKRSITGAAILLALAGCTSAALDGSASSELTAQAYVARHGGDASIIPTGQYALDGRHVTCGTAPTVLDPYLHDYAMSYPKFIVLRPDRMAKPATQVKLWIYFHECGHVLQGPDESNADCFAVTKGAQDGWLKADGLDQICAFISAAQPDSTHFAGSDRCLAMRACYAKMARNYNSQN